MSNLLWLAASLALLSTTALAPVSVGSDPLGAPTPPKPPPVPKLPPAPRTPIVANGELEVQVSPWVATGTGQHYTATGVLPHGGKGYLFLGQENKTEGRTCQDLDLPASAAGNLTYWLAVSSEETSSTMKYDVMVVEVRDRNDQVLKTIGAFSNLDKTSPVTYSSKSASLADRVGSGIRLCFRSTTDSALKTIFRIDDVSVN